MVRKRGGGGGSSVECDVTSRAEEMRSEAAGCVSGD